MLVPGILVVAVLFALPWAIPLIYIVLAWKKNLLANSVTSGVASAAGIELHSKAFDRIHRWEFYTAFAATKSVALLYQSDGPFILLPRRHFKTEQDWCQLLELAKQMVGAG